MHSAEVLVYQWQVVRAKGNQTNSRWSVAFTIRTRVPDMPLFMGQVDHPTSRLLLTDLSQLLNKPRVAPDLRQTLSTERSGIACYMGDRDRVLTAFE